MSFNTLFIKLIKSYQKNKTTSGRCRHYPCCSDYGLECFQKFGFLKASTLTTWRILRCNPFSKKVFDPVPLTKKEKREHQEKLKKVSEIEHLLLEHHHTYPFMMPQDDLMMICEVALPVTSNISLNVNMKKEPLMNHRFRVYLDNSVGSVSYSLKAFSNLETFWLMVEIWQKLVQKKQIQYPISKKQLKKDLDSFLIMKTDLSHSDIYIKHYPTHYCIIEQNDSIEKTFLKMGSK